MKYKPWARHPRTTAEKRANQEGWERPRRRPHLLPDTYDDIWVHHQKSWKAKRKTQYHPGGRGQHHHIRVEEEDHRWWITGRRSKIWRLETYLEDHNIPYRIDKVMRFHWMEKFEWYHDGYETITTFWGFTYEKKVWKRRYLGTYRRSWYTDHYIVHWWYNKDIGVDYIL